MKIRSITGVLAFALVSACSTAVLPGQDPKPTPDDSKPAADSTKTAPDNTKVNERDRSTGQPTADQATNKASDRELMQQIRKSIMDDSSMSTYAHNVKVIAQKGKVTLKGPVRSDEEKQSIEQKATQVAGAGNVTNQLTVKAARP